MTPTPLHLKAKIDALFNNRELVKVLAYLAGRWLDEREYEDLKEYAKPLTPLMPEGFTIVKMIARPFGFQFRVSEFDAIYLMTLSARGVLAWKRIK